MTIELEPDRSIGVDALNRQCLIQSLRAMQSQMPVRESPGLRDAVNFDESRISPIHRWFRYREGFSPAILDKLSGHQRVFDPFCGCGTTLVGHFLQHFVGR